MTSPPDPWAVSWELTNEVDDRLMRDPDAAEAERRLRAVLAPFETGRRVDDVLVEVEDGALLDVEAPLESSRPGVAQLKHAVRKANSFIFRHVAHQVQHLLVTLSSAVRNLDRRVMQLEGVPQLRGPQVLSTVSRELDGAVAEVVERLSADVEGPVRILWTAVEAAALPPASSSLVVVSGESDTADVNDKIRLLASALLAVRRGDGRVAVVASDASSWAQRVGSVLADLSPGHPLHPDTWLFLLRGFGCTEATTEQAGPAWVVHASRAGERRPWEGEAPRAL